LNARAPEGAGKYRPEYKVGDADLSQRTADIIAGEAIRKNPASIDAVINNMMNRVGSKGWGPSKNLQDVATAPGQYEAAWKGAKASPSETEFIRSRIKAIASGGVPDSTKGANSYRAESYYRGEGSGKTWARTLGVNGTVVGGNRYTFDPSAANGPYAPYATPKDVPAPATAASAARRPEVLADPSDERRKPAGATVAEVIAAVRTVKSEQRERAQGTLAERASAGSEYGPQTPYPGGRSLKQMNEQNWPNRGGNQPTDWKQDKDTGNWKPVFGDAKPNAAINAQRNGAIAAIQQARSAQAATVASTSNDNRSTSTSETSIGQINIHTAATDASGIARDIGPQMKRHAFASAANYARA
jgi:hypothetical protein